MPRKGRLRRRAGEMLPDVKKAIKRKSSARKIKRTLKDSAKKYKADVVDKRELKRKRLEDESSEMKMSTTRLSRGERKSLKGTGVKVDKVTGFSPTRSAKRAKRKLRRMGEQDLRKLKRKLK